MTELARTNGRRAYLNLGPLQTVPGLPASREDSGGQELRHRLTPPPKGAARIPTVACTTAAVLTDARSAATAAAQSDAHS